jgi:hypothetical protein
MTNYHDNPDLPLGQANDFADGRTEIIDQYREMMDLAHELDRLDVTDNAALLIDKIKLALKDALDTHNDRARLTAQMLANFRRFAESEKELSTIKEAFETGDIHHPAVRHLLDKADEELEGEYMRKIVLDNMAQTIEASPRVLFGLLAILTGKDHSPGIRYDVAQLLADMAKTLYEASVLEEEAS